MHAAFELTVGLAKLKEIISHFPADSPHWNEAENRFQFVDRLLVECLGWEKPDVRVEVHDALGGRADYVLGRPAKAILEAKREAKIFQTVPQGKPSSVRKLAPLLLASKNLDEAVRQVIPYCVMQGAQIGIVCNGPQLAIFQAMTPGMSPLEGECFFFNGFSDYVEEFVLLWSLLSPEGITENRAYRDLALHRNPRIPPKASEAIPEPKRFRYRTAFQENLRSLSETLLEEIEDNPALKSSFYKECYVTLEANNRHLLLSKKIIAGRYNRVDEENITPSTLDRMAKRENGTLVITEEIFSGSTSRPIVVIGDVGVGKTSFFENLYENLDRSEKANTYFIHIDIGKRATLTDSVKSHVLNEIPNILRKNYGVDIHSSDFVKSIYHDESVDFDRSTKGQLKSIDALLYQKEKIAFLSELESRKDDHLRASLGHLAKGRNKQIILIMDNADQRSFEVQQEAFLIAQELAATRNLLVYVALRPSTFYQSKTTGALSAYQNKILTISPPPADEVVERRLVFAVRVAEGKVMPAALQGIRLRLTSVVLFINAMLRSVRYNPAIRLFLSNITGGNTRAVIELITGFFGSPNVDSEKIVSIEEKYGNYKVPLHEFTKQAMLGDYAYYNSQSSLVACNIFDTSAADPREHFLASMIVAFLNSNIGIRDNDGFIAGDRIVSEMARHGFIDDQVRTSLRLLARKKMIETPHAHYRELPVPESSPPEQYYFRATSIGIYHISYWTGAFGFLDATSIDTPIFDSAARETISKLAASFDIRDRYEKATVFKQYLEDQWHQANFPAGYYNFPQLLQSQVETFQAVQEVVSRFRSENGGES